VQQDVIGLKCGIGFQFATPVAIFVLLGEELLAGAIDGSRDSAGEIVDSSKMQLRL
jgi:hypothetical protein